MIPLIRPEAHRTPPDLRNEHSIRVVAADPHALRGLLQSLAPTPLAPSSTADLEAACTEGPRVLLVDPTGWENRCRRILEAYETRPTEPPAVLLTGQDPGVIHRAGPCYAFVPRDAPPRVLTAAVHQARRAWKTFAPSWPSLLREFSAEDLAAIGELLEAMTGLASRRDRAAAFQQAVRTRLVGRLCGNPREYADLLRRRGTGQAEAELLAALLLVGETYFWRYSGQFRALQECLLPDLLRGREAGRPLRLWSAGCSTGEEVYSLAMACREAAPGHPVEVLGTDLHRPSLAHAESGEYGERALRNLPARLRARYISPTEAGGRVIDSLREGVTFEVLNLGGPEFAAWARKHGPFDAIFCRNTLIYLGRPPAEGILKVFETSLGKGGGLFLGASETLFHQRRDLEPVRAMGSFFYRKGRPRASSADSPTSSRGKPAVDPRVEALYREGLASLDREDFAGGRVAFEKALELSPTDPRGHTGLALLLANDGRETEAFEHLQRALGSPPELPETQYLLGLVAERTSRQGEALRHYGAALRLDPGFFMAHVNRAWILRRLGQRAAFSDEMKAALAILKGRPRVSPWVTGGMGWEALLGLVADSLGEEGGDP